MKINPRKGNNIKGRLIFSLYFEEESQTSFKITLSICCSYENVNTKVAMLLELVTQVA